jgi:guanylate kinase
MERKIMINNTKEIKEKLKEQPAIIAVSGPSGSGKDYLTNGAMKYFSEIGVETINVQMVTERPHRGEVETKICVSPTDYTNMQNNDELIGDHINKVRYGYSINQIKNAIEESKKDGKLIIIELNPDKQMNFPKELKSKLGIEMTAWIGVETTPEQTEANMRERGESEVEITNRVNIFNEFINAMKNNPNITMCNNGPDNRTNAVNDFVKIIKSKIND